MNNADLPAMPQESLIEVKNGMGYGTKKVSYAGLTKREMFALHAPKCPEWYDSSESDVVRHIRWPAFYADCVLKELSK